jgi:hypothetical protein
MRKAALFISSFALCAMPVFAATETYKDVSIVDVNCSAKAAADADSHTRACALKCAASGYGIITQNKQFLKFDAEGNAKITQALTTSDKKDHLRVDVTGDVQGDTLRVTSIKLL